MSATTLLAGCDRSTGPSAVELAELAAQRSRWERLGASSYDYYLAVWCECITEPLRISVREGQVSDVVVFETGQPPGDWVGPSYALTIDDLFDRLADALREADQVDVDYDPALGYPRRISIDYSLRPADDEVTYSARLLTSLP